MTGLLNRIAKTPVLWSLFIATIAMSFTFQYFSAMLGIAFIDSMVSPDEAMAAIASFTPEQRIAHAWITGTLDIAYPLAYGLFFAGTAAHFFDRFGSYLGLLLMIVIPVDVIEGIVQILALTGNDSGIAAKAVLTPLKFTLFFAGLAVAIAAWIRWLWRRLFKPAL